MIKCFTGEQYNGICVCVHLTQTCYAQNTCAEMEKNMSQQQYDISPGNKNLIVAAKAGLVVSIINYAFCLISICVVIGIFISQLVNIETGSSSGWFLFMVPVVIGMYILSCVPDTLSFLFALLLNAKKKMAYPLLIIICSIVGCFIMTSALMTELLVGFGIIQWVYTIFKIIIILLNMVILSFCKKAKI